MQKAITSPIASNDLFSAAGMEMPLQVAPPKIYVPPGRAPDPWVELAILVNETGDQAECARILAEEFPDADRADMEAVINQCERELMRQGFSSLNQLRRELVRVHPSWKRAP